MMNAMKKTVMTVAVILMAGFSPAASAADAKPFGVVDMNKVMQTTDVAKDIFSQLDAKRKEYQVQISKEEDALRAEEEGILKQKNKLSKEDFAKKGKTFEEKVLNGQKNVQNRKRTLDVAFNKYMSSLHAEAEKIITDVAKEKNYPAVFTREALVISSPDLDMTDAVIERMNKNVKKMTIDWTVTDETAAPSGGADKK